MNESRTVAMIAVTSRGLEQAQTLRGRLRTGEIHRPGRHGPPKAGYDHPNDGPLSTLVPDLFARFDHLVFFLAAGAAVRLIAPCLGSKATDPGVIVVDEGGEFVVPILSGHEGGANALALEVAGALGATPVITTGSEAAGGLSLASLVERFGWMAEPASRLKDASRAMLDRAPVAIIQEIGGKRTWLDARGLPEHVDFATSAAGLPRTDYEAVAWITDRVVDELGGLDPARILWFRPRSLVLGVGCERGITAEALEDGLDRVLREHGLAPSSIGTVASLDLKSDEAGLIELAGRRGWQTAFFDAESLARVPGLANPSDVVRGCVGTPGVAEPAALLAAGADRLLVEKQVVASPLSEKRMTIALARRPEYRGRDSGDRPVIFIGAGPGDPDLLTLRADHLIRRADVVVYAGSLIPEEIVRRAPAHAVLHNSAHLVLEEVAEILVAASRAGKRVVRLQSGDPSLYSATQEQMTLLDEAGVPFEVVPGISAYQAGAAALKSELTLPEVVQTVILTRGEGNTPMPDGESLASLAAHRATLCLFLSARLGERVQQQLSTAYPPETPVAILYRVSWPDEKIIVTDLAHLAAEIREHRLTRTTLIMVGQAIGGRKNRSQLYDGGHGHIFRRRTREAKDSAP
jgi:precorrin-4 C11-methyltransferase